VDSHEHGLGAGLKIYIAEVGALPRFWSQLRKASVGLYEDGCLAIAKGAAYSALLAFFPVITTLATILVQANADAVARVVARLLFDVIPPGTENIVRDLFKVEGRQPITLLVVAILLSGWAGSGFMLSLIEGFRAIYRIPSGRSIVKERLIAIGLVFVTSVPVLGASVLIVVGNRARASLIGWLGLARNGSDLRGWLQVIGQLTTFLIAVAAIVMATWLIFYFGPNRKQKGWQILPGAVLTTVLWLLSTLAFGWYVREITNYNVLYGSVGAGLALLVWSYLLAVIMLLGCEFNAVREKTPA
jgi:membrane protein